MSLKCKVGIHQWQGCKCLKCGTDRGEGHDWSKHCELCATCNKTRENVHNWTGCKCKACGNTRDEGHDWSRNCEKCARCAKVTANAHDWNICKCSKCGHTRNEWHVWDGCKCTNCGRRRDEGHDFKGCKCSKCGTVSDMNRDHDWTEDCRKCAMCGKARTFSDRPHFWKQGVCIECNTHQLIYCPGCGVSYRAVDLIQQAGSAVPGWLSGGGRTLSMGVVIHCSRCNSRLPDPYDGHEKDRLLRDVRY
jgi:hypothetical protein